MNKTLNAAGAVEDLPRPTPWPNANARLLGVGVGLPVEPLDRLAQFSALDFERFTLEWAFGYLAVKTPNIHQIQQRGGAGDKGRDVVVWLDPPSVSPRRWSLYQCKHYGTKLGAAAAIIEVAKVLFYTFRGDYAAPQEYWFVTHLGMTSDFQDMLDNPEKLRSHVLSNWTEKCSSKIRSESKGKVPLTEELTEHIKKFDFSIFRAKQPHELISEHAQTPYHLTVFGLPLIERPAPPLPPSSVASGETEYVRQLFEVIGAELGKEISDRTDLAGDIVHSRLFDRSRITFYCAEGLKELARDQMADPAYFDTLLKEFVDGLFHDYTATGATGMQRLLNTVKAAQSLQLGGHILSPLLRANDREGMCHQMANEKHVHWSKP